MGELRGISAMLLKLSSKLHSLRSFQILIQQVWSGTWNSAFLTISQVIRHCWSVDHIWSRKVSAHDSLSSVQFSSFTQLCPTLCDPMNCSTPGLPVHHQLPEFTETHIHWVGDAIQPSHPLSSSSPPAPNPSQHQSLFQWVKSLHEVAKVLEFQL